MFAHRSSRRRQSPRAGLAWCTGTLLAITAVSATGPAAPGAFEPSDHYRLRSVEDPQWSPDAPHDRLRPARRMTQASNRSRSSVWVVKADGGSARRLTPEADDDSQPRWSPDGRWHRGHFVGRRQAIGCCRHGAGRLGRRRLVSYDASNDPLAYQGVGEQIAWSPDSRSLAFLSADPGPEPPGTDPYVITRLGYKSWSEMNDNRRWHIRVVSRRVGRCEAADSGRLPRALDRVVAARRRDRVRVQPRSRSGRAAQLRSLYREGRRRRRPAAHRHARIGVRARLVARRRAASPIRRACGP